MDSDPIYDFLTREAIRFERHDHVPVYTSEQARQLVGPLTGASTKNLFLRDKKGVRHFLLTFQDTTAPDLKALAATLNTATLSLGSPERLLAHLGITPGAVSLLALINDPQHKVEVLMDEALWQADAIQCHPLVNTSTLVIPMEDVRKFLAATGHQARVVKLVSRPV
jgi:Ala-tRNA(Pro) deacylase